MRTKGEKYFAPTKMASKNYMQKDHFLVLRQPPKRRGVKPFFTDELKSCLFGLCIDRGGEVFSFFESVFSCL